MRNVRLAGMIVLVALAIGSGMPMAAAEAGGGDVLWEDRVDGVAQDYDQAGSITTNASVVNGDAVFVAGVTTAVAPGGAQLPDRGRLVRAYALGTGRLIWEDRHAPSDRWEEPGSIAAEGNGVFTAGTARVNFNNWYLVRAYDRRSGRVMWEDAWHPSWDARANDVAVKNGRVFVVGYVAPALGQTGSTYVVRAYDAATGALLWQDRQGFAGGAYAVRADGGRVFVLGRERIPTTVRDRVSIRAYDASSGALLWENRTPPDHQVAGTTVLAVAGSRAFVAGTIMVGEEMHLFIRAHDVATGAMLWETVRAGAGSREVAAIAAQKPRVFVAGNVFSGDVFTGGYDFFAGGYDATTGGVLWEDQLHVGNFDQAAAVVASADRVFVAGTVGDGVTDDVVTSINLDYIVRAYNAQTGRVEWSDRIDSGFTDAAMALATQGDRVFAAGILGTPLPDQSDDNSDFFVRAYEGR